MEQRTNHQIVAATNNQHKLSEIRPLIEPDFRVLSLEEIGCNEDLPETQHTIEGNSFQKAAYVHDHFHLPCFADDTGLEVDGLSGDPGVFSARYAGAQRSSEDNITLLLKNLSENKNRKARFRTVITLIGINGVQTFEGIINGSIMDERKGAGGFGYDPIFKPAGFNETLAEMTLEEKNAISHRGQAVKKLVEYLKTFHRA
ncbi:MAG: non-canonical purine NTP diphosphatase [Cyclobacteriaceae bacterium]